MHRDPSVPGRFMAALGEAGIRLLATAQGHGARNIAAVVRSADSARALRTVHSAFLSHQIICVGVVGLSFVGAELLELFQRRAQMLSMQFQVQVRLCALLSADKMLLSDSSIDLTTWREQLAESTEPASFPAFLAHMQKALANYPHALVIDTTCSFKVAEEHLSWVDAGFHVITANIKALAGPLELYNDLCMLRRQRPNNYFYEVAVGGGLPVINTLSSLMNAGDPVARIEGVFSASLSFIFNSISTSLAAELAVTGKAPTDGDAQAPPSFTEAVHEAWAKGLLEVNPMLDLMGSDASEKLLALGRELGLALTIDHVDTEPVCFSQSESTALDAQQSLNSRYHSWRKGTRTGRAGSLDGPAEMSAGTNEGAAANGEGGQPLFDDEHAYASEFAQELKIGFSRSGLLPQAVEQKDSGIPLPMDAALLAQFDERITERVRVAHANGRVLRYVGQVTADGVCSMRLRELPRTHPFAALSGPELCVQYISANYSVRPLTVQGPLFATGTATGAFTEFLTVARTLGARYRPVTAMKRTPSMVQMDNSPRSGLQESAFVPPMHRTS